MPAVEQRVVHVDGVRIFYRRVPGAGPPAVFVHGNPTHSEEWLPFLEQIEGPAVALDLPGWGFSDRPDPHRFDFSMHGLARFFDRFLEALGIGEHSLVVTDWGAIGLIAAQRRPALVRRLVVINAVPLLPGYRWHPIARRFWRRRWLGELFNRGVTETGLRLLATRSAPDRGSPPAELVEAIWRAWPRGGWPQMLALYRSGDPELLAAAGDRLGELGCPALVVWGLRDPYLPARFGRAYAKRLPNAELVELDRAGHWPWFDRPQVVERVLGFLAG